MDAFRKRFGNAISDYEGMKTDNCRITKAYVCIVCEEINTKKDSNGIDGYVCSKCGKKLKGKFKWWNKAGIYATNKKED